MMFGPIGCGRGTATAHWRLFGAGAPTTPPQVTYTYNAWGNPAHQFNAVTSFSSATQSYEVDHYFDGFGTDYQTVSNPGYAPAQAVVLTTFDQYYTPDWRAPDLAPNLHVVERTEPHFSSDGWQTIRVDQS
jgi:hypothetical protein